MTRQVTCPHCNKTISEKWLSSERFRTGAIELLTEEVRQMLRDRLEETLEFKVKLDHLIDVTSELDEDVILIKMEIARLKGERIRQHREELYRKAPMGMMF